jgi:hypothetical protein
MVWPHEDRLAVVAAAFFGMQACRVFEPEQEVVPRSLLHPVAQSNEAVASTRIRSPEMMDARRTGIYPLDLVMAEGLLAMA